MDSQADPCPDSHFVGKNVHMHLCCIIMDGASARMRARRLNVTFDTCKQGRSQGGSPLPRNPPPHHQYYTYWITYLATCTASLLYSTDLPNVKPHPGKFRGVVCKVTFIACDHLAAGLAIASMSKRQGSLFSYGFVGGSLQSASKRVRSSPEALFQSQTSSEENYQASGTQN